LIGPGQSAGATAARALDDVLRPIESRPTGTDGDQPRGGAGTEFFGLRSKGDRFVYVIDASGSMYEHSAIAYAKAELLASVGQLEPPQQFQIVFYNEKAYLMKDAEAQSPLFRATDANRAIAEQFVRGIRPDGGTRHLEALTLALGMNPDTIYFLTDAGEPVLKAADVDTLKRLNKGRTRIHCIEFGKGANLAGELSFISRLASQNGGQYQYRDVTRLGRE
jgi:hypothetical protein